MQEKQLQIELAISRANSHSFISIQPLGRFSRNQNPVRRPVWLWHCILSKFLGVGCHCFTTPQKLQKRIQEKCQIKEREVNTVHVFSLQRKESTNFPPAVNPDKTVHGTQ